MFPQTNKRFEFTSSMFQLNALFFLREGDDSYEFFSESSF